jgi:uncharacterized coiled-coil DUF342 family protein
MLVKKIISLLSVAFLFAVLLAGFVFRQDIYDWFRLRNYEPPKKVQSLATKTSMNDEGTKLFYVAHPKVIDAEVFNQECHVEELSIVLGCYTRGNIYLYSIDDKRLAGVMEVTAAHEMLHVAYERLGSSERERIDGLLSAEFKKLKNERIKSVVEAYRKNDPSSVPNELHSILGTEVADLSPELEEYYSQYFDKRRAVVKFSNQYESEFSSRQNRVEEIDAQLKSLQSSIDQNQALISAKRQDIDNESARLSSLRSSGNVAAYNAAVPGYNTMINEYNALVNTTKAQIAEYNELVKERNNLAVEVQDLVEAIDSTPETIQ